METISVAAAMLSLNALAQASGAVRIGNATFETRTIDVEGTAVAIADVNGDGHPDLLSAGRRLTVQLGDGAGELRPRSSAAAGHMPVEIVIADVNEDGHVDIVIANHEAHYVTILEGDGQGGFAQASTSPLAVDVDPHPHAVDAADLDNDGRVDLLVDHSPRGTRAPGLREDAGGVLVMAGRGKGRFESPGVVFECGGVPYRGFIVGDVNADGRPDIVTPLDRDVGVLLNTSDHGRLSFRQGEPIAATDPFMVTLSDCNADGRMDVISASGEESSLVEVLLGDGRGGFREAEQSPLRFARGAKNIVLGDFNGDDALDAAVTAYHSERVMIVFGGADTLQTTSVPTGQDHPWGLAAGDLNADGVDDLLIVGDGSQRGKLYLSRPQ